MLVTQPAGKGPQGRVRTGEQSRTECGCSAKLRVCRHVCAICTLLRVPVHLCSCFCALVCLCPYICLDLCLWNFFFADVCSPRHELCSALNMCALICKLRSC